MREREDSIPTHQEQLDDLTALVKSKATVLQEKLGYVPSVSITVFDGEAIGVISVPAQGPIDNFIQPRLGQIDKLVNFLRGNGVDTRHHVNRDVQYTKYDQLIALLEKL